MKLLKKSQPQKEAAPVAVSLKAQLKQAVDAAEKYIATIAQREKDASPLQPLTWHELNLRLQYGRDSVSCALALLEKESNGK